VTDAKVLSALPRVRAPDLDTDGVSLGFARDLANEGGRVGFTPVVARLSVHALRRPYPIPPAQAPASSPTAPFPGGRGGGLGGVEGGDE